jgi:hypothetical protein
MKSAMLAARPSTLGLPVIPRQMAHTIVDLPVPFGPMMTFKLGPGENSTESYVLKELVYILLVNVFDEFKLIQYVKILQEVV